MAPEGVPFVGIFFVLTVIAIFAFGPRWAVIPLLLTLFMLMFFRDPDRAIPQEAGYLAPADGKVIRIEKVFEPEFLKQDVIKISIFMNVFNVHVNRAPCAGTVREVRHFPGKFLAADKDAASLENENTAMVIECAEGGPILVRQIAGLVARRVVNRMSPGDTLTRGQRYGLIKFSSRLDIYLPENARLKVQLNQKVRAGLDVLAMTAEE